MGKSDLMTEFLRARLLSERSVSKTARERADELASRVAELEEKLKFVSLQREKAEKATSDILAILKNHEIGDVSEDFDSSSKQEENSQYFKARNGSLTTEDIPTNLKLRNSEKEAYSSSEIESTPSTGRSLSWISTRDSQHSLEKKKYVESVRRRASFSSNHSSSRRVGKSCRRIRRKDTRSVDELQNEGIEKTTYSKGSSNYSDGEPVALPETSGTQKVKGHYFIELEENKDMESALLHQAQLICRYEEEEQVQREWEEKFRENNSGTQDSCDPGNYSDVTEERYETKSPDLSCAAVILNTDNQEVKQQPPDACVTEEPQISKTPPSVADGENVTIVRPESSASEFSFPKSEKLLEDRSPQYLPTVSTIEHTPEQKTPPYAGKRTPASSSLELAIVPQETSNSFGSVLEALQQAKLSLSQKLSSSPQVAEGRSRNFLEPSYSDRFQMPFGTPGLFRLPTDYQCEATTRVSSGIGANPSFANFPREFGADRPIVYQYEVTTPGVGATPSLGNFPHPFDADRFLTEPFVEPRSGLSGDLYRTVPSRSITPEMRPVVPPPERFLNQPRLGGDGLPSTSTTRLDPYSSSVRPSFQDSYPFLPDITLHIPSNEERASSSEKGLPPLMRLSSYDQEFIFWGV
ncbi:hypothetical protein OROMI_023958 [Orobanche minor]